MTIQGLWICCFVWNPCKQRFEAVFIESKSKPSQDDIVKWINKCRSAQEFIEESDEIPHKLCSGTGQEDIQCSKSIDFLYKTIVQ